MFVCEKRAAIDVVYARLRQCGLSDLSCLIHDSQSDKKEFVMDLKQTYEGFLSALDNSESPSKNRSAMVDRLQRSLAPLSFFDDTMRSIPTDFGVPVRQLIDSCIQRQGDLPQLDVLVKEKLPSHSEWHTSRPAIQRFEQALKEAGNQPILAQHPMRILSPRLASEDRPLEMIASYATEAQKSGQQVEQHLSQSGIPREQWEQLSRARLLIDYAQIMGPIVKANQINLLDSNADEAKWFNKQLNILKRLQGELEEAARVNEHWRDKLSPEEATLALEQAVSFESSNFSWIKPSWWRLRGVLNRCYDFKSHKIRPRWSQVLRQLQKEHEAVRERNSFQSETASRLNITEDRIDDLVEAMVNVSSWLSGQPRWLAAIHAALLKSPKANQIISRVSAASSALTDTESQVTRISDEIENLTFSGLKQSLAYIVDNLDSVSDFLECLRELQGTPQAVSAALRHLKYTPREIESAISFHSLDNLYRQDKRVERFTSNTHRKHTNQLEESYDQWLGLNAATIRDRVRQRFLKSIQVAEQSAAKLSAEEKEFKRRYNKGRRELEHEFGKQMRYKAIRDLVAGESGDVVNDLKPIWLMSPLSVSDTLPLAGDRFDVVIFDEASQITLEEAVPALFRAQQSIIVGDEMQLPPTDFFSAKKSAEEDEDLLIESDGELIQYDLDSGSFLSHAANNLSSTMLGWHYRSRSESLISFSNWAFYDGRLLTVPDESLAGTQREPIVAETAAAGVFGANATVNRPISFHSLSHGVYDKRRNRAEAEYIAEMVRALLNDDSRLTIGIVAFSEAQQDEIEQALTRLSLEDKEFRGLLESEFEREEDGQFVGLLVKNLENIQGDERDIIILSVCYGHPPSGKMRMNFGPINKSGGEKRLNVAFSRAKHHMAIVSSIDSTDITNDYNDGANCLKNYLRYAEAVSIGDSVTASRIMHSLSRWTQGEVQDDKHAPEVVAEQLTVALKAEGYLVDHCVGQSHFRCDLAVYRDGDRKYRLGILIDGTSYYEQEDLLERDMLRPRLLRAFGWRVTHVLAKDWLSDSAGVTKRLLAVIEGVDVTSGHADDFDEDEEEAWDTLSDAQDVVEIVPEKTLELDIVKEATDNTSSTVRRLEFHSDKSSKFWEIKINGAEHTVRFGRIGSKGQSRTKAFANEDAAKSDCERLIREKHQKGYRDDVPTKLD